MKLAGSIGTVFAACAAFILVTAAGCEGPQGPAGPSGDAGMPGPIGAPAPGACPTDPSGGIGLTAKVSVSTPTHGTFFAVGEAPSLTIRFLDGCGRAVPLTALGTANLYLNGPRAPLLNKTASKLLNCVTDRNVRTGSTTRSTCCPRTTRTRSRPT